MSPPLSELFWPALWDATSFYFNLRWPFDDTGDGSYVSSSELLLSTACGLLLSFLVFLPSLTTELYRFARHGIAQPYVMVALIWTHLLGLFSILIVHPPRNVSAGHYWMTYSNLLFVIVLIQSLLILYAFLFPIIDAFTRKEGRKLLIAQSVLLLIAYPSFYKGIIWYYRIYLDTQYALEGAW